MPDRSDEFRKAAADCLVLARTTADPSTRVGLLTLAQRWFDLANGPHSTGKTLEAALRDFNDQQMSGH